MEPRRKLLIAEDDDGFAKPLVEFLCKKGFDVVRVADGPSAMSRIREADLCLFDVFLHGATGLELLAYVRRIRPGVPVILMSGKYPRMETDKIKSEVGADGFLCKPFAPEELLGMIRVAFA